ncbi:MAG: N-acetylmuramoyl-L-alanine amidase [Flavobacteriales bacterium]|jgi:PKD repeat protein/N-acetyl-anhydromuramyl-L-alanine amidase AmpD|nr:N-acetylmuramoyl-L-alanine amidase [Flavobacteriales bacterium]
MKKLYFLISIFLLISGGMFAQTTPVFNTYQQEMNVAYQQYPNIPRGMLEAVSYKMTHFSHIDETMPQSCFGLPRVYGVMGLTENGEGYFRSNLNLVAQLSGYTVSDIKASPQINILAYAAAYNQLMIDMGISPTAINEHDRIIIELSEIPRDHNVANDFAMNSRLYGVFSLLKELNVAASPNVDLVAIFGANNLRVLSSGTVNLQGGAVNSSSGTSYVPTQLKSSEYGPALWVAAPSCNKSSRSGTAISAVTVHTIQGSYAGAISWSQNCSSNVSYHYVVRSSDGQVTQMVLEAEKAWHVSSANPYAIGIEHEGYVSDASWYTNAMYTSSANLSRDITQSGYGILPIRTYYGASSAGLNTLGACTQIKGHQHFPNQTHTDPGINWNWKKYYNLINNTTNPTTATAASGNYFDSGGANGNYTDDERTLYLIQPTGASTVTINFSAFDLENNWDYLFVYDGATTSAPLLATLTGSSIPSSITSTGGSLLIEFRSDCATSNAGWALSWSSNGTGGSQDLVPPSSVVTSPNVWETADFVASFTDTDNSGGSGVGEKYYQVINYNGTEWRANDGNGFLKDNFETAINGDWAQQVGTWSISNNALQQTDETESNSNLYALLDQNIHDKFLYHWSARIEGTGTNKRAGAHFMSDDGGFTNRKNSYFVYFRADDDKIQIYKVTNDVISLEHDVPYTVNANQWHDIKITYDKTTGEIDVWLDNVFATSWTDPNPIIGGDYFSLRNGNCIYKVDNLNVYHNRASNEVVTIGAANTNDIRYQNPDPSTFSGKVKSLVVDNQHNISTVSSKNINVDWTAPLDVTNLFDGTGADISSTSNNTQLSANWTASSDQHSGVARYWYAIGTTSGGTDVVNWTDNWFNTSVTATGLSLTQGTTYYVSVRAENGAGLLSNVVSTDGQIIGNPTGTPVSNFTVPNTYVCSNDSIALVNNSTNATSYLWSANGGTINAPTSSSPYVSFATSGSYTVSLVATGPGGADTSSQTITVVVDSAPVAMASQSDTMVCTDNPMVTFTNQSQNANGYLWSFGDGSTSTDANPWHAYDGPGVFNVTLTAINGTCPNDVLQLSVTVDDCSDIKEEQGLSLLLYPNPALDHVTLMYHLGADSEYSIVLYDLTGRKVLDLFNGGNVAGNHVLQFDVKALASGNYHLVVQGEEFKAVKPLVIR